jgi:cytochrome c
MLVGYLDGNLVHLDSANGRIKREFKVEPGPVWAVAFSANGHFGLTAGVEERVKVWHLASGDRIDVGRNDPRRATPWLTSDHPGARTFRKCAGCHALTAEEPQRSGPHFAGLFGRHAGAVDSYRYSEALSKSPVVWSRDTIAALFREGPDRYLPGTKMPVQRIGKERELNDLIDYLAQIVPPR